MKYYCINDENELSEIESKSKLKDPCFQEEPVNAIKYMLDIQEHCLRNEEYAVKVRKEKVNKLQQMYYSSMNDELKYNDIE